jgi:hypothetical protein
MFRVLHFLEQFTRSILCGCGVGLQFGNVLICLSILFLGPEIVVGLLTR